MPRMQEDLDAYSPLPIEGLAEAIGFRRGLVPLVTLIGAIIGGTVGYLMQYWINVVNYPLNMAEKIISSSAIIHHRDL